ncbi:PREDICTED: golgin subfamily A member 2-like [Galeopterus variegatus]|uniref:Golgin subfamily A member 2-like n=1 Tax=Galeopterus variegatus TaxID=482537 RepID=A0ABM0R0Y8_GALVR|nr:PREDICTED: golgin subfamily A member 2-like [Galeopterus variegatus]
MIQELQESRCQQANSLQEQLQSYHDLKKQQDVLQLHLEDNKNNDEDHKCRQSQLKRKLQVLVMEKAALQLQMKKLEMCKLLPQQVHDLRLEQA